MMSLCFNRYDNVPSVASLQSLKVGRVTAECGYLKCRPRQRCEQCDHHQHRQTPSDPALGTIYISTIYLHNIYNMCHRFSSPFLLATGCFEPGQSNRQFIIQIMRVKIVSEDTIQFFQIFMKNVIRPKMNGSNGILSRIAEKC